MFSIRATILRQVPYYQSILPQIITTAHTKTCPTNRKSRPCPPTGGKGKLKKQTKPMKTLRIVNARETQKSPFLVTGPVCSGNGSNLPKRATKPGKVRLGFIPDEWFLFFHSTTGVTGPYIFGIMLINYLISKEIYVMEHEYYTGLSIFVMVYYATTNYGGLLASALDKEIDEVAAGIEKTRTDEIDEYEGMIKQAKNAQWQADGQKLLMDAKKANIAMQLEAAYRERLMQVYITVKGRMDYHVRLYQAQARIQQKWMLGWILSNVIKSITPELEKQALNRAIQDLASLAGRAE